MPYWRSCPCPIVHARASEQPDRGSSPEKDKGHGGNTGRPQPPGEPDAFACRQHDGYGVATTHRPGLGLYVEAAIARRVVKTHLAVLNNMLRAGAALVDVVLGKGLHNP